MSISGSMCWILWWSRGEHPTQTSFRKLDILFFFYIPSQTLKCECRQTRAIAGGRKEEHRPGRQRQVRHCGVHGVGGVLAALHCGSATRWVWRNKLGQIMVGYVHRG